MHIWIFLPAKTCQQRPFPVSHQQVDTLHPPRCSKKKHGHWGWWDSENSSPLKPLGSFIWDEPHFFKSQPPGHDFYHGQLPHRTLHPFGGGFAVKGRETEGSCGRAPDFKCGELQIRQSQLPQWRWTTWWMLKTRGRCLAHWSVYQLICVEDPPNGRHGEILKPPHPTKRGPGRPGCFSKQPTPLVLSMPRCFYPAQEKNA